MKYQICAYPLSLAYTVGLVNTYYAKKQLVSYGLMGLIALSFLFVSLRNVKGDNLLPFYLLCWGVYSVAIFIYCNYDFDGVKNRLFFCFSNLFLVYVLYWAACRFGYLHKSKLSMNGY